MKYLREALTNDLKITQHFKEKKANIQLILHVCIYTTKNEILSQIKTRTLIKLYQVTIYQDFHTDVKLGTLVDRMLRNKD